MDCNKDCNICIKTGYFIIPARVTLEKCENDIFEINKNFPNLPKLDFGYKYVLKSFRAGYLYVKDKTFGKIYCYGVNNEGLIYEVDTNYDDNKVNFKEHEECFKDRGALAQSLLLAIPEPKKKRKLNITFSIIRWTPETESKILTTSIYDKYMTEFIVDDKNKLPFDKSAMRYYDFIFNDQDFHNIDNESVMQKTDLSDLKSQAEGEISKELEVIINVFEKEKKADFIHNQRKSEFYYDTNKYNQESSEISDEKRKAIKKTYDSPIFLSKFFDIKNGRKIDIRRKSIYNFLTKNNYNVDNLGIIPVMDISALMFDISISVEKELKELTRGNERQIYCQQVIEMQKKFEIENFKTDYLRKLDAKAKYRAKEHCTGYSRRHDAFDYEEKPYYFCDPAKFYDKFYNEVILEESEEHIEMEAQKHWSNNFGGFYSINNVQYWKKEYDMKSKEINENQIKFLENLYCFFYNSDILKTYFNEIFDCDDSEFKSIHGLAFSVEYAYILSEITTCKKPFDLILQDLSKENFKDSFVVRALVSNNEEIYNQYLISTTDEKPFMTWDKLFSKTNKIVKYGLKSQLLAINEILIMKLNGVIVKFLDAIVSSNVKFGLKVISFSTGINFKVVEFSTKVNKMISEVTDGLIDFHYDAHFSENADKGLSKYQISNSKTVNNSLNSGLKRRLLGIKARNSQFLDKQQTVRVIICQAVEDAASIDSKLVNDSFTFKKYLAVHRELISKKIVGLPRSANFLVMSVSMYTVSKCLSQLQDGSYTQDFNTFVKTLLDSVLSIISTASTTLKIYFTEISRELTKSFIQNSAKLSNLFAKIALRANVIGYTFGALYYSIIAIDNLNNPDGGMFILATGQVAAHAGLIYLTIYSSSIPYAGWIIAVILIAVIALDYLIRLETPTVFQAWLSKCYFGSYYEKRYPTFSKEVMAYDAYALPIKMNAPKQKP